MATLAATNAVVDDIIKNDSGVSANDQLGSSEVNQCIAKAVEAYSRDRPLLKYMAVIGNSEHELDLPSDWSDGKSVVKSIEYPAGDQVPNFIDENNYRVVKEDTTKRTIASATAAATSVTCSTIAQAGYFKDGEIVEVGDDDNTEVNWISSNGNATTGAIALKNAISNTYDADPYIKKLDHILLTADDPESSDYSVVEYTLPHTLSDSSDTTYAADYYALSYLAAANCCYSLAALFSMKQESTIAADSVDFGSKATEWQERGDKFRELYNAHMGKGEEGVKAASGKADLDPRFQHGRELLFHGLKTR